MQKSNLKKEQWHQQQNSAKTDGSYHSLDEVAMADVILVNEGKHPPGKIYSLIKSELCLYSSYLSSGIDMNYKKIWKQSAPSVLSKM